MIQETTMIHRKSKSNYDTTRSICIPIMNMHISKAFIYYVFERFLGKNIVQRVDLVTKKVNY